MHRPFPVHPRGPRRRRARRSEILLACPRVDPKWELGVLRALIKPKPQTRGAIAHRDGEQHWPTSGRLKTQNALEAVEERLDLRIEMHWPKTGEYFMAASVPTAHQLEGLALATVLSATMPELWFVYGRLFLQAGRYYRRERGIKLWLVEATNVHLPRAMRNVLRDIL